MSVQIIPLVPSHAEEEHPPLLLVSYACEGAAACKTALARATRRFHNEDDGGAFSIRSALWTNDSDYERHIKKRQCG